ncbi:hypothetical protein H8959_002947 [Pygathrix nigripes]
MDLQLSPAAWGCPVGADTTSLPFGPLPRTHCLPGWGEGRQRGIREISILEGLSRSRKVPRYDNPRLPEPPAWCGVGKPPESPSSHLPEPHTRQSGSLASCPHPCSNLTGSDGYLACSVKQPKCDALCDGWNSLHRPSAAPMCSRGMNVNPAAGWGRGHGFPRTPALTQDLALAQN